MTKVKGSAAPNPKPVKGRKIRSCSIDVTKTVERLRSPNTATDAIMIFLRPLTGFGLGAALPLTFVMANEFAPFKTRARDRKSTRLNSSHGYISYAVFCLKKKKKKASPYYDYKTKSIKAT